MDSRTKLATEEFVRFVRSSEVMKRFQTAQDRYNHDSEVSQLRNQFMALTRELQKKQYDGTITKDEISRYKALQQKVGSHPISRDFAQAQQQFIELLRDCNTAISEVLGFDFASTAAPAASCC